MNSGEFDFEPIRGLPGKLPQGEQILWQGAPLAGGVARRVLHVRVIALYFAAILLWQAGSLWTGGATEPRSAVTLVYIALLACAALGFLSFVAWLIARTTVYTITNKRVVMRFGMALPVSINIPFGIIEATAMHVYTDGSGDIPLDLASGDHIAYLHLWPHARPWRIGHPQPMLRVIPQAAQVAALLGAALAETSANQPPVVRQRTSTSASDAAIPASRIEAA